MLIATILSQNTNDKNSHRAYTELRRRFPKWDLVASARLSTIRAAIRSGGMANQKAPRIKAVLDAVREPVRRVRFRRKVERADHRGAYRLERGGREDGRRASFSFRLDAMCFPSTRTCIGSVPGCVSRPKFRSGTDLRSNEGPRPARKRSLASHKLHPVRTRRLPLIQSAVRHLPAVRGMRIRGENGAGHPACLPPPGETATSCF